MTTDPTPETLVARIANVRAVLRRYRVGAYMVGDDPEYTMERWVEDVARLLREQGEALEHIEEELMWLEDTVKGDDGDRITRLRGYIHRLASAQSTSEGACPACGQVDVGQTGEYPCRVCGLPLLHDALARKEVDRD